VKESRPIFVEAILSSPKGVTVMTVRTCLASFVAAATVLGATVSIAGASAPPVGRPLPKGPVTDVSTPKGQLVAVALQRQSNGRVWRIARSVNAAVLRQVSEANVGSSVVVVFRATGRGTARVVFALTRGETAKALASATYNVRVK
jgi:hypothetical protein